VKNQSYKKPLLVLMGVFLFIYLLLKMKKKIETSNHWTVLDTLGLAGVQANLRPFILAQAMHESNNFRSAVFLRCNNAFGYNYVPGNTFQLGKDAITNYAKYASLKNNVLDLAGYYNRRKLKFAAVVTPEEFVHVLKTERYFEDTETNYLRGVKGWLEVLKTLS
jgi:hypothetical protein